jgi:hypothetical protein
MTRSMFPARFRVPASRGVVASGHPAMPPVRLCSCGSHSYQPQALASDLWSSSCRPTSSPTQVDGHAGEHCLQMTFSLADVAFLAHAVSANQGRQTAFHSSAMLPVDGFEVLGFLASACSLQQVVVRADGDGAPTCATTTSRTEWAGLAGCFPKTKLGSTTAVLDAFVRYLISRTNGNTRFPIHTELILGDPIRHTCLRRLSTWHRANQINTPSSYCSYSCSPTSR